MKWTDIKGYEQFYQVSDAGLIRSKDRKVRCGNGVLIRKGKLLKPQANSRGYLRVCLSDGVVKKFHFVHRLVASHFCFKPKGCDVVNHKDFNYKNNKFENLEWTTTYGNFKYSFDRGRFDYTKERKLKLKNSLIEKTGKPIKGENIQTGDVKQYKCLNDCKYDGFQTSCVSQCCNGIRKSHKGYRWWFE